MLLIIFVTLVIFLTGSYCDRPETPNEIPRYQEEDTVLSDWDILLDYVEMEVIRRNMLRYFPIDDFFFIGNPLAYIGLLMLVRNQLENSTSGIIRFMPFSGSHVDVIRNNNQEYRFARDSENYPTDEELENYKEQLRKTGLDPKSILERYEISGNRTVIVQEIGTGMVSFLEILCNWAKLEGISPDRLSNALRVFGVIFENNGFPDTRVMNIGEYRINIVRLELTSVTSLNTMRRIAYPERNTGYVRLVPNYPSQLWNEPPMEFDEHHVERLDEYVGRLVGVMRQIDNHLYQSSAQGSGSDLDLVCRSRESRFKRDLSNQDLVSKEIYLTLTSDEDVLRILKIEYDNSSRKNMSPIEFIKSQLKNSSSVVSRTLQDLCDRSYFYYSSDENETLSSELLHFSPNRTKVFKCMKRYRLFRCGESYESSGVIKKIANSVAEKFSGVKTTEQNVREEVENLVYNLVSSYHEFPVDYIVDTTKDAALYCSNRKIVSTLECPAYYRQFISQIMLAWFCEPHVKNDNLRSKELMDKNNLKMP